MSTTKIFGTGANDNSYGSTAWTNPGNITADDANTATASPGGATTTNYLKGTMLGNVFSLASNQQVDGIKAEWEVNGMGSGVVWDRVRIVKGGTIGSTDKSTGAGWPPSATLVAFGGATELWGETWSYSDINNSGFGSAITASTSGGASLAVDYGQLTVYHSTIFDAVGTMSNPAFAFWCFILDYARVKWPERRRRFAMACIRAEILGRANSLKYVRRPQTPGERFLQWAAANTDPRIKVASHVTTVKIGRKAFI